LVKNRDYTQNRTTVMASTCSLHRTPQETDPGELEDEFILRRPLNSKVESLPTRPPGLWREATSMNFKLAHYQLEGFRAEKSE